MEKLERIEDMDMVVLYLKKSFSTFQRRYWPISMDKVPI